MSLIYKGAGGLLPLTVLGMALSASAHVALPALFLAGQPAPPPAPAREESGIQGAIMFDLSDIIAAPSDGGEDSAAVAEAEDAPTVTEAPELVEPAQAADEPLLNQTPYDVDDETLKFAVATPDPVQEATEKAREVAQEFEEEKIEQNTQIGSVAAEAAQASVSSIDAQARADKAKAASEGLTAEDLAEITDWQKAVVLRIAKAKSYPQAARRKGIEGEVRVRFTLDRYGAILAHEVETSSGSSLLDTAALRVFDELGKLPTPPRHLSGESFTLVIPLNYRIKKG